MQTLEQAARPSRTKSLGDKRVGTILRRSATAFSAAIVALSASVAAAQQPAMVQPGTAVVTGYSGFLASPAPDGADPFDYTSINTDGPVARVIDLTNPGPQGVASPAQKLFTVTAGQVGQVFGVAIDNSPVRNFYLAATSAYGLSIYVTDDAGNLKRVRQGESGAQFVPGTFGPPELGGSPGSIWRVAGDTGDVSLLTTIDSGVGSVAGLGGLAFDPVTQQLFAAERSTGIIYRLALNGAIKGKYDHGVEGRPNAGLGPVPLTMPFPADINTATFDTGNPATWGFAAPARRVFGLAVYKNRLYYSVAQGPQIWSAGINPSGAIPGKDARLEVEVPALQDGTEITSITFDGQGRMYLAERGATTGDYYLYQLANAGQSRVLRYLPKQAGDPNPGRWRLAPEQYSIGLAPAYNNADGGVALGYGYTQQGGINPNACGATVWSTGERLLDPDDGTSGFPTLDGIQGNAATMVQPQNTPPTASWFVDFDDQPGDANFRGHMGAISTIPCAAPIAPPPPPQVTCPQGTYFSNGQCLIYPKCPPGTNYFNGQCVYPQCPPGFIMQGNQCIPPPLTCPPGTYFQQGQCIPLLCPPGLIQTPNGYCVCPQGTIYANGQCVPPNLCPPGAINLGGICICPLGLILQGGTCNPFQCPPGQVLNIQGQCVPLVCPPGQQVQGNQCVPIVCPPNKDLFNGQCVPKCPPNQQHTMPNGVCAPTLCLFPQVPFNGQCVNPCPPGQQHTMPNGVCQPPVFCPPPKEIFNGQCVPKCPPNQQHTMPNGACGPLFCLFPKQPFNGQCVNPCPPGQVHTMPNGVCQPLVFCLPPKEIFNGQCVPKCPLGQVHTPPNGACQPLIIQPPILCLAPNELYNGQCVPKCPLGQVHTPPNGACEPLIIQPPILCLAPNELVNGNCVPKCGPNQIRLPNGMCIPKPIIKPPVVIEPPILCLQPNELFNGNCVPPCPPNTIRQPNGFCLPGIIIDPIKPPKPPKPPIIIQPILCLAPNELVNGNCVPKCPPNTIRQPNGFCLPKLIFEPPVIKPPKPLKPFNPPVLIEPPVFVEPPVFNPEIIVKPPLIRVPKLQINPQIQIEPQECAAGEVRNKQGNCVQRLQLAPKLQIQPQIQIEPQMQMEVQPNG